MRKETKKCKKIPSMALASSSLVTRVTLETFSPLNSRNTRCWLFQESSSGMSEKINKLTDFCRLSQLDYHESFALARFIHDAAKISQHFKP